MRKVIITAAVTGSIHTPTMSPYLPITPDEIVEDAVGAYEAGAAIVHLHVRNPETGETSSSVDLYREVAAKIKKRCPLVINFTSGGGLGQTVQERTAHIAALKPEIGSFNMGSINIGLFPLLDKYHEWKFAWEKEFIEKTRDYIFLNTFKTLEELAAIMQQNGVRPECEIYEVGMIDKVAYFLEHGLLTRPICMQFVLGLFGTIPASAKNLLFLIETADKAIGDYHWSVAAAGRHQFPLGAMAIALDGNVRVGLEDALFIAKDQLARSSAEQVERIVQIVRAMNLEVATPDDAREILRLKGSDMTNF